MLTLPTLRNSRVTSNITIHLSRHRLAVCFAEHTMRPGDGQRSKDVDQDFNADGLEAFSDINEAKKSRGPVVQFMISPMAP
jgi:hypothetical protein